jgi:hypothetical protein
MIPIAEMIERQTNNRKVDRGILARSLSANVMKTNVRQVNNVPVRKTC